MKKLKIISRRDIYISIIVLMLWLISYMYFYGPLFSPVKTEIDNIMLDRYNFKQLEKIKSILSEVPREEYKFARLADFNRQFDVEVIPKKYCYYIMSTHYFEDEEYNWNELGYIFATKIHSKYYSDKYPEWFFVYPEYNLPIHNRCYRNLNTWEPFCYDWNFAKLEWTIVWVCTS